MNFSYFISVGSPAAICRKADFDKLIHLPFVAQLISDFRAGNADAKKRLPAFCFHAFFPKGARKSANAVPSGMVMVDFDHLTEEELKALVAAATPKEEEKAVTPIMLVHITPSGKGLRIVMKATRTGIFAQCRSISDYQHTLARHLECEHKLDEVTTDLTRLSFVPQASDVLYFNDRMFTDRPEVTEFDRVAYSLPSSATAEVNVSMDPTLFPDSKQTEFDGVPLTDIFREYILLTGGIPKEGCRNSRYYAAARDLRYICDFNPRVVAAYLPKVGLPASEVFQLCVSACQSNRSSVQPAPANVMRALSLARIKASTDEESTEKTEEAKRPKFRFLPHIARDFVRCCPDDFKEATILSLLPVIGTLSTKVRARYIDGELHSTSFFTVVTSEQASGKSFTRRIVRILLSSISEEDAGERIKEQAYRDELRLKKNSKDQPEAPRVKIRIVPASISLAKLLQRLDYADGEHLFTFCEEMDTIIKSNRSGTWSMKNDLYRNGFDNTHYGQDYMSEASYSANLPVYYNLLVLGTPRQVKRFFSDIENGLASRCCFATIADQFGARMPEFRQFDEAAELRVEEEVKVLRQAEGEIDLSFMFPALDEWQEKQRLTALCENDHARDIFRRRAAVIGFRAVLAFAPLYNLSRSKNRENLCQFGVDVADLVLRNQLEFAGERLNKIITEDRYPEGEKKTFTQSIFEALPEEFTSMQVAEELNKRGMKSPARQIIYVWNREHLIVRVASKKYRKL